VEEKKIIDEIKNGNFNRIKEIIDKYSPLGFRILLNFTGSKIEAEEILQDIWVKIYDKIIYIKEPDKFKYWFLKVIYNRIKNMKYPPKNEDINENNLTIIYNQNEVLDKEIINKLDKIVRNLDIKYQMPIVLFYFENFDYNQISEVLEKNINTVKSLIKRGKEIIRKKLEEEGIKWKD